MQASIRGVTALEGEGEEEEEEEEEEEACCSPESGSCRGAKHNYKALKVNYCIIEYLFTKNCHNLSQP